MSDPESKDAPAKVRCKIWIERGGEVLLSEWRIDLLRGVQKTGSLAKAAEELNVPYRTAWQRIKELEARLGTRLLTTESGGSTGGGSTLTIEALDLVERFERLTDGIDRLVEERMRAEFSDVI